MSATALAPQRYTSTRASQRPALRVITNTPAQGTTFQWDAKRDLKGFDTITHQQFFPPHRGQVAQVTHLPDAGSWAANLAVGILEIFEHYRPHSQLQRWVVPQLYSAIVKTIEHTPKKAGRKPRFRAITYHCCAISERIAETCVIVHTGERKRVVSIRLEGHASRWVATAVEIL